jgi:hypothetical protein
MRYFCNLEIDSLHETPFIKIGLNRFTIELLTEFEQTPELHRVYSVGEPFWREKGF